MVGIGRSGGEGGEAPWEVSEFSEEDVMGFGGGRKE